MRHHLPRTRWALMVLALGIVTAAANAAQPLLVARLVDRILQGRAVLALLMAIAVVIAVLLASELLSKLARARYVQELRDRWRDLLLARAFPDGGRDDRRSTQPSEAQESEAQPSGPQPSATHPSTTPDDVVSRSNNDVETVIDSWHLGRVQFLLSLIGWLLIRHGSITVGALVGALQFEELLLVPMLSITDSLTDVAGGKQIAQTLVGEDDDDDGAGGLGADGARAGGRTFEGNGAPAARGALPDHGSAHPSLLTCSGGRLPLGEHGPASDVPALEVLALEVPALSVGPGDLVLVTGASGTGKTTLMRLLAGEVAAPGIHVGIHGRLAYVPAEEPAFEDSFDYDVSLGRPIDASRITAASASVDSDSGRLGTMAARCTPDATPGWTQHWELGAAPDRAGHMWVRHRETNI